MLNKNFECTGIVDDKTIELKQEEKYTLLKFVLNDGKRKHYISVFDKKVIEENATKLNGTSFVFCKGKIQNYKKQDGSYGESFIATDIEIIEIQF